MPAPVNLLKVEHIPQKAEAGCLPACVQMVTHFLGKELTQAYLVALFEALPEGIPASRIKRLEQHDLKVIYQPNGVTTQSASLRAFFAKQSLR
jgi:ABC-type bacteriocin/lantibiotic exporter with double-glycine peptidase domain